MRKLFSAIGLSCLLTGTVLAMNPSSSKTTESKPEKTSLIKPSATMDSEVSATYEDIKKTLGFVPTFMRSFPQSGIAGAWGDFKGLQLSSITAIPVKYKELIGHAVSSQIPCKYCTYFHSKAAKLNDASELELNEAVAMAASVRRWSTFMHGIQLDEGQFRSEIDKLLQFTNKQSNLQAMEEDVKPADITTPEHAYKDMEMSLGMVPTFLREYPVSGVVGVWKEMKGLEMNPDTALPPKYKHLVGLGVAAQVPCSYCVYFHTQAAYQAGASKEEINEAIAMAGLTRQWSTVLNGLNQDDKAFRLEADRVFNHVSKSMKKEVTLR